MNIVSHSDALFQSELMIPLHLNMARTHVAKQATSIE